MVITAIQAILIAFAVGVLVGAIIGWKLTFNMRLARIQEQQVMLNKLKFERDKARSELRTLKMEKAKEKVSSVVDGAGRGVVGLATGATGAVSSAASSLKSRLWGKKDDNNSDKERKELQEANLDSDSE